MTFAFKKILDDVSYVEIPDSGGFSSIHVLGPLDNPLIVDTYLADSAARVIATLEAAGVRPGRVRAIIITHGHNDHYGGADALAAWSKAPIWSDVHTAGQIEDPWGYFAAQDAWAPNCKPGDAETYAVGIGKPVRVQRILREGDTIEHDGLRLEVLHTPGHERGELTFHDADRHLVFTGDLVQGGMDASKNWLGLFTDSAAQRRSLHRVMSLKPEWNFKGHRMARCGADVQIDLASAITRLDRIENALLDTLREKSPLTVADLTRATFKGVLGMDVIVPSTYGVVSVTAFLLDLGRRGLIRRNASWDWEIATAEPS